MAVPVQFDVFYKSICQQSSKNLLNMSNMSMPYRPGEENHLERSFNYWDTWQFKKYISNQPAR